MDIQGLLSHFAVALGIGLLIGLERGWKSRDEAAGSRTAGIRTFSITGLLGGTVGAIAQALGGAASAAGGLVRGLGFAAFTVVFALFCRDENQAEKTFSATTAVAGMLTFALGAFALLGDERVAAGVAVAAAGVLALRENLHGLVKQMTWPELRSALVLLAMTFVILPLVPDDPIGPAGGINPREVWLIAIALAGVSFLGYIAVRQFGSRHGVLLAAAAGGLASSTAVTLANARHAAAGAGAAHLLAAGVALATAVSFARVVGIVALTQPVLLPMVAAPLTVAAAIAAAFAVMSVYWRKAAPGEPTGITLSNPFNFWSVVGFAVFLGIIILGGRLLSQTFGAAGTIASAAALGLADVDAVTVSMARLVPLSLDAPSAAAAILVAVIANTVTKLAIGAALGRGQFAVEIAAMSAACVVGGGIALWAVRVVMA